MFQAGDRLQLHHNRVIFNLFACPFFRPGFYFLLLLTLGNKIFAPFEVKMWFKVYLKR